MVDYYGRWTYLKNTQESEKCDMDRLADMVDADGYKPQTTIENLCEMIYEAYFSELDNLNMPYYAIPNDNPPSEQLVINTKDVKAFIQDYGGYEYFDYTI